MLGAGVRAAVEVEPQRRDVVAEPRLERVDERGEPRLRLGDGVVAVRLAGAGDRAAADRVRVEREAELGEPRDRARRRRASGTSASTRFCCRVTRASPPSSLERALPIASSCSPRDEPEVDGDADRRQPVLLLPLHADVVGELALERREREVRQRVAEALLDLGAHPLGPDVVDHELHARLDARDAVAEVLPPGVEQRAQHRDRLVRPDEDAQVARDPRHGREAAADEHAEPGLAVAQDADERDAVDLRREAAVGARADRDLVLARQVDVVRVAGEEGVRLLDDGRRVEQLVVRDAGDGAAGDRAHGVAAAAEARQPGGVELLEDVGELGEAQVVELDVLPRRQLGLALAVLERELADRLRAAPASRRPAASLIRSMKVPTFGLSW